MAGTGPGQEVGDDGPAVTDGGGVGIAAAKATTRKAKVAKARVGAVSTAAVVNWREADRAAAQAEAAARLPWRAAIAHARKAKREARAGLPVLSPAQREIAYRVAGGRGGVTRGVAWNQLHGP